PERQGSAGESSQVSGKGNKVSIVSYRCMTKGFFGFRTEEAFFVSKFFCQPVLSYIIGFRNGGGLGAGE
ncbi:MAG: hypothetical protein IKR61_00215, partial [Lachnospiraceae bacterium]|nr:hypothetical protein [Lachnospiraceae bacterium]